MAGVTLEMVSEEDKAVLANLLQLYRHDLSEVRSYELSEHGTFIYRFLDHYWSDPSRDPFFIRHGGRLAGFALARVRDDGVREVAEFFVARAHRRAGVGRAAARALLQRWSGSWELFHDDANSAAAKFWACVVAEVAPGTAPDRVTTSAGFVGQRYRFCLEPPPAASPIPQGAEAREPIEIAPYDPSWPGMFAKEAARIAEALGEQLLGIEHIGSTAVEGLAAKPVIDIQVGVRSLGATPAIVRALSRLGYVYVPEFEAELPNRRYFRKSTGGRRSHQVHLVERTDTQWWDRHVAFRDWLRTHPADAAAYSALKIELAERHRDDRRAYTDAKADFISLIVGRARSAAAG
jgi:GrpB-like predicted nucleotidyltransferase (UPF0157 family)/predicted acetyltransferase